MQHTAHHHAILLALASPSPFTLLLLPLSSSSYPPLPTLPASSLLLLPLSLRPFPFVSRASPPSLLLFFVVRCSPSMAMAAWVRCCVVPCKMEEGGEVEARRSAVRGRCICMLVQLQRAQLPSLRGERAGEERQRGGEGTRGSKLENCHGERRSLRSSRARRRLDPHSTRSAAARCRLCAWHPIQLDECDRSPGPITEPTAPRDDTCSCGIHDRLCLSYDQGTWQSVRAKCQECDEG